MIRGVIGGKRYKKIPNTVLYKSSLLFKVPAIVR